MTSRFESLSACEAALAKRLSDACVTKEEVRAAQRCWDDLSKILRELFAGCSLFPFGSMCNGFAVSGCDLDVTCDRIDDHDEGRGSPSAHEMLDCSVPAIQSSPNFEVVDVVRTAMIPIIRVRYKDTLDVDVSFRNRSPLPNTQLLRAYSQLHPVVHDLVVLVKLWAKASGVCGAVDRHLSAYSLTLMAIYFLQVDSEIWLPCLPTALFKGDGDIPSEARVEWSCQLPRAQVLSRFFAFFAQDFQWGREVVSIRHGWRGAASLGAYEKLRGTSGLRLHIEDPFLTHRNLNCVLSIENEHKLFDCLTQAATAMRSGGIPEVLAIKNAPPHDLRPIEEIEAFSKSGGAASSWNGSTEDTLSDIACSTPSAGVQRETMRLGDMAPCESPLGCRDARHDVFIDSLPDEASVEVPENGGYRRNYPALPRRSFTQFRNVASLPGSHSCAHQPQRLQDLSFSRQADAFLPGYSLLQQGPPTLATKPCAQNSDQRSAIFKRGERCHLEAIRQSTLDFSDAKTYNADNSRCHYYPDQVSKRPVGKGRSPIAPPASHEVPFTVLAKHWRL